ncbi:hypothetical protein ANN_21666 [Periplaneta americana]|uniref:Uncharacterized protein n=1 Tax=Periplaneta americana TaxID=6978 RepID=A0ABQ8S6H8_PERAM|nr:hypothetical protein ANN_21666 [Periplaneta americana]
MVPFIRLCDDRIISKNLWTPRSPDLTTPDNIWYRGSYGLARSMWTSVPRKKLILSRLRTSHNIRDIGQDIMDMELEDKDVDVEVGFRILFSTMDSGSSIYMETVDDTG